MRGDLDREIDAVVSAMLDVDSRQDLRARVLERIAQPSRRSRLPWVLVPIVGAAVLMLIVMTPWQFSRNAAPLIPSTSVAESVRAIDTLPPGHVSLPRAEMTGTRAARSAAPALTLEVNEPPIRVAVEPLEPLHAIDVPPVAISRLDAQEVTVDPLAAIEQIDIQPVGPPEGRN
jgi:hypothetical protein